VEQSIAPAVRLFVGLALPDPWRSGLFGLQRRQDRLAPGYFRWVQPELLHLTVVFLGATPAEQVMTAAAAIERAAGGQQPFPVFGGRVGTFGQHRAPRVLWVEIVQPEGQLQKLREGLERELQAAQVAFDPKPFVPHVTLGRARDGRGRPNRPGPAPRLLAQTAALPPYRVTHLTLFESQPGPNGSRYRSRAVVALGRASSPDASD
jgi:2'-5' RNA ligase